MAKFEIPTGRQNLYTRPAKFLLTIKTETMKKNIGMLIVLLFAVSVHAQQLKEAEVPAIVKDAFAKKYPGVNAKWEKEGADYEAEFDWNKVGSSAIFDASGFFKELEQEIKIAELPAAIVEYCNKNFIAYKLNEAEKITDASGNIRYGTEMKKGKEHMDIIFDQDGNFIKKEEPETNDHED